jgi:serine phosphatase RsbU (regulator of sigma subunit)
MLTDPMESHPALGTHDASALPLEQQVVRLQALLEASRAVHSTIDLTRVLEQAARIAVLELELDGAFFTTPYTAYGKVDGPAKADHPVIPLLARDGKVLSELVVIPAAGQELSLYERDFLEGLALQTALAVENAMHHQQHLEWARLEQDLDAARLIQQSLLPQKLPAIHGYSIAARSRTCYQVGGDYLDIISEAGGAQLMVIADVAGKGLASALVCTTFRSAFRALARESRSLVELSERLSQQHWEEGMEARRRYVTAIFLRLDTVRGELEIVNCGHNPACLLEPGSGLAREIGASGPPLGLLQSVRYAAETVAIPPGGRLLLYTDGLTEVFCGDDEFGLERLVAAFHSNAGNAESALDTLWSAIDTFACGAPQQDDMTAIALHRLTHPLEELA